MLNEQIRKMNLIKGIFKNLDPEHQNKTLDLMTKIYQEQQEQRGQETPAIPFLKAAEARTTEEIQTTIELEIPKEIAGTFREIRAMPKEIREIRAMLKEIRDTQKDIMIREIAMDLEPQEKGPKITLT